MDAGANQFLKDTHARIAKPVVQKAKGKARVKTGRMKSRIKATPTTRMARIAVGQLIYGPVQHWGWPKRNITPNRFLSDAIEESEDSILRHYAHLLGEYVEKQPW